MQDKARRLAEHAELATWHSQLFNLLAEQLHGDAESLKLIGISFNIDIERRAIVFESSTRGGDRLLFWPDPEDPAVHVLICEDEATPDEAEVTQFEPRDGHDLALSKIVKKVIKWALEEHSEEVANWRHVEVDEDDDGDEFDDRDWDK